MNTSHGKGVRLRSCGRSSSPNAVGVILPSSHPVGSASVSLDVQHLLRDGPRKDFEL